MPIPKKFAEAPEVPMGLELYLGAFWDLSTCRQYGFGISPIPFTAIMDYAQAYEFSEDQTEDLVYYTKVLDKVYIEQKQRESKSSS